jgi:RNA polymerase sigma-70 factor (ECF subfamily)
VTPAPLLPSLDTLAAHDEPLAAPVTFERLYDDHAEFVWRNVRRLGVDLAAAEDVVQQVFLVVHRRLDSFDGSSTERTWLFGILLRVVRDHRRTLSRKRPPLVTAEDALAEIPDLSAAANPEQALSRAEAFRAVARLLEMLEEDKRVIFVMAELEQMSALEIGQALGMDPKAVYSRLRAARTDFERAAASLRRPTGRRAP